MKKLAQSTAILALALAASSALAADLPSYKAPPPPPPPPPPMWTGFYVGLNAGYTWSSSNNVVVSSFPLIVPGGAINVAFANAITGLSNLNASTNNNGFIGGGQVGYNWQFASAFVAGVEADIQGIAGSNNGFSSAGVIALGNGQSVGSIATVSRSLDYIGTVRGRLGWLFTPTLLVYGTGGLAYGGVTSNTSIFQALIPNSITTPFWGGAGAFSDTRVGWTAGGGVEWMFWPNWSAKVEYLYYDLGNVTYSVSPLVTVAGALNPFTFNAVQAQSRFDGHIVRAGLNYHFNWGAPAPVYAKY